MKKNLLKVLSAVVVLGTISTCVEAQAVTQVTTRSFHRTTVTAPTTNTTKTSTKTSTPSKSTSSTSSATKSKSYTYSGVVEKEGTKLYTTINGVKYTLIGKISGLDELVGEQVGFNASRYSLSVGGKVMLVYSYGVN